MCVENAAYCSVGLKERGGASNEKSGSPLAASIETIITNRSSPAFAIVFQQFCS